MNHLAKLSYLVTQIPIIGYLWRWILRPRLINFGVTSVYIRNKRSVYIGGRVGGYKTSLSIMIAYELWRRGYIESVYSNMPCVFNDSIDDLASIDDPRNVSAVCIWDEAANFFQRASETQEIFTALRKVNLIMLMPSADRPTTRVIKLLIEPFFVGAIIGLPLVVYRTISFGTRRSDDQTSFFVWWQPRAAFGLYDTTDFSLDTKGLDLALLELKDRVASEIDGDSKYASKVRAKTQKRKSRSRGVALAQPGILQPDAPDLEDTLDRLEELSDDFLGTVQAAADANPDRLPKRRKGIFG